MMNSAEGPPNYEFGEDTLYETHRAPIRWIRKLLRPFLKLQFNPNPLIQALHIQAELNRRHAHIDTLNYEIIHNLVIELTRAGIEVKNLKMRLESMASRLDFDERRARALEGVVQYRPGAVPPLQPPTGQRDERREQGHQGPRADGQFNNALDNDGNERRSRRRRRRGRRRGGESRGPLPDTRGPIHAGGEAAGGAPQASADRTSDVGSRSSDSGRRPSDSDAVSAGGSSTPPPDAPSE